MLFIPDGAKPQTWGSRVICKEAGNSGEMNFSYEGLGVSYNSSSDRNDNFAFEKKPLIMKYNRSHFFLLFHSSKP